VTLRVEAHPDTLELQVADDGDGIDADLRRQLFRTFTQGRRRVERTGGGSKSGLGLGLAIAAKITELHGGRIAVASPGPGQGATFSVHLPRVVAPKSEPKPVPKSVPNPALARSCQDRAPAGLPILVVDDNDDAAESLAMLLRALGHQVRICNAGAEALAAVVRERPRVVLLDLGMADMDGFETARRLRALEREQRPAAGAETALSPMLLVAVSGYGDARTRERGRQAGIDRHLTKPVSSKTLRALLGEAAKQPTGKT
jgi:CheY-like chemotaxis protein